MLPIHFAESRLVLFIVVSQYCVRQVTVPVKNILLRNVQTMVSLVPVWTAANRHCGLVQDLLLLQNLSATISSSRE